MDLLQRIIECKDEEVDSIIEQAIKEANENAEKVDRLGFLPYLKVNSVHKGFIPLSTRIKYSNLNIEDYGMETTDFIYDFAHFVRKNNIHSKSALVSCLVYFSNIYFGLPGKNDREDIFNDNAWRTTTTDEEYFEALKKNKIGDLKGKGAAQCTERGALVQQILSLFGFEVYYCIGCHESNGREEGHCFNIVKCSEGYALLDCSMPVDSLKPDGSFATFYPFLGALTDEEFLDFIKNGTVKTFTDYHLSARRKVEDNSQRSYVVGRFQMEKEDVDNKSNTRS